MRSKPRGVPEYVSAGVAAADPVALLTRAVPGVIPADAVGVLRCEAFCEAVSGLGGLALLIAEDGRRVCTPIVVDDGVARRATPADRLSTELLWRLVDSGPPAPMRWRELDDLPDSAFSAAEAALAVDQTNESVVVGDQVLVKYVSQPEPGPHPLLDLLPHLSAVGFTRTPRPYALLSADTADGPCLLATVVAYHPTARDGWDWLPGLIEADLGVPPAKAVSTETAERAGLAAVAQVGLLTAEMLRALATPSLVLPEPVLPATQGQASRWAERARVLGVDVAAPELVHHVVTGLASASGIPTMRGHGDWHVGQVLLTDDGRLWALDWDGNPVVPAADRLLPEPASRDVAGMLASLAHAAAIVDKRHGFGLTVPLRQWLAAAEREFVNALQGGLADTGLDDSGLADSGLADGANRLPSDGDLRWLLDPHIVSALRWEQEWRDLHYARRFLPRWEYAPTWALAALTRSPGAAAW